MKKNFENIIKNELSQIPKEYDYTVIQGLPSKNEPTTDSWLPHVDSTTMLRLITEADIVFCRSGYSTIMDLIALGKTAVLIPTPGQTEQEYLADYLSKKGYFFSQKQNKFRLKTALSKFENTTQKNSPIYYDETKLRACLKQLSLK